MMKQAIVSVFQFKALWLGLAFVCGQALRADPVRDRYGAVSGELEPQGLSAALCAVAQSTGGIPADASLSVDLVGFTMLGPGQWVAHLEGASSVREGRLTARLPAANADAGSAAGADGQGRVQISEVYYSLRWGLDTLSAGLLNASAFLDNSWVANDETRQFLGSALVNNSSIGFPGYTLGLAYHHEAVASVGYHLLLAGSHGLSDNPSANYADLFDLGEEGKGLFLAAEVYRPGRKTLLRLGGWANSARHEHLDGSPGGRANLGVYAVLDGLMENRRIDWSLRLGTARRGISPARLFASLAAEYHFEQARLGAGLAWGRKSAGGAEVDAWQGEVYLSYPLAENLSLTPSLQWLRHGGPAGDGAGDALVAGVRLTYAY